MTFKDPVTVTGDLNIHIERQADPNSRKLTEIFRDHGMSITVSTHNLGGTLDVVFTSDELSPPAVITHETGLSDHSLLKW